MLMLLKYSVCNNAKNFGKSEITVVNKTKSRSIAYIQMKTVSLPIDTELFSNIQKCVKLFHFFRHMKK